MAATVPPFLFAQGGTFAAPFEYEVPASGEVQPYTASATYTNASGQAILPALRLKSASGNLLALTFPVGQTIADGSASEVTFVPPFGSASGSSTSTETLTFGIAYRSGFNIPTAPGGSGANLDPWDYIDSSDANITLNGSGQVSLNEAGLYETWTIVQVSDATWLGTDTIDFNFQLLTGGLGNHTSSTWPGNTISVGPTNPSGSPRKWQVFAQVWVNVVTAPEVIRQQVLQVTGGATHTATSTFASISVNRVGPASGGGVN